jgi:hypothetical protein
MPERFDPKSKGLEDFGPSYDGGDKAELNVQPVIDALIKQFAEPSVEPVPTEDEKEKPETPPQETEQKKD